MDDSLAVCRRLRELLNLDEAEIAFSLQGEIFDEYKKLLEREIRSLQNIELRLKQK